MNKTKIDLDNNLILRSKNIEYNNDNLKNTLDNNFNYSTAEQKVGKWIGKPLYRKVITTVNLGTSIKKEIPYNIDNVDKIWIENGYVSSTKRTVTLPMVGYNGSLTDKVDIWIERSTDTVNLFSNGGWGDEWEFTIILNYTKTTD